MTMSPSAAGALRVHLRNPSSLLKLAGVHNVLGARLASAAGFEGLWASSLEISASRGVPDADVLTWRELLAVAAEVAQAVSCPVVADCQSGFGGPEVVRDMVAAYDAAGVAGVCLEDGVFPHKNSLLPGPYRLARCTEFVRKLQVACKVRQEMLIMARVQALVAGCNQREALERAYAYADTGVDALVIHSRSADPRQVLDFIGAWESTVPLVLIPTTYHSITIADAIATGKVRMVIYANHGLRAAIAGMKRAFREILDAGTAHHAEQWIAPMDQVFELQSSDVRGSAP